MPRQSPFTIDLTQQERAQLEARIRQYTLPYRDVLRARLILLAAADLENKEIADLLGLSRPKVSKWRKRFYHRRLAGLRDGPRSGRPSSRLQ